MSGNLKETTTQSEHTDELPILSEEALLWFGRRKQDSSLSEADQLDVSVEALRRALGRAEQRWSGLESRIEAQDRAIAQLQITLDRPAPARVRRPTVPELTEVVFETGTETEAALESALADANAAGTPDPAMLERIAGLETYIAGRADHWRAMEASQRANAARLAELERELEQRIAREQNLQQRLSAEGDRGAVLRNELRRLRLQLRELRSATPVHVTDFAD